MQHPRFQAFVSVLKSQLVTFQSVYVHPNIIRGFRTHSEIKSLWNFPKSFKKAQFLVDFDPKTILAPTNWGGTFCHQFNTYLSKKELENTSKFTLFTFAKVKIASASFGFSPKNSQNRDSAPGIEGGHFCRRRNTFFNRRNRFNAGSAGRLRLRTAKAVRLHRPQAAGFAGKTFYVSVHTMTEKKTVDFDKLYLHEFLSVRAHIYKVSRWHIRGSHS